jgi:hypothetical protein
MSGKEEDAPIAAFRRMSRLERAWSHWRDVEMNYAPHGVRFERQHTCRQPAPSVASDIDHENFSAFMGAEWTLIFRT